MPDSLAEPGDFSIEPPDAEALADPRVRDLVVRFAQLSGATVLELEPQLLELQLPPSENRYFRDRDRISIAFSLGALERHPDAEMAVVGSAFLGELVAAVRQRGTHIDAGLLPPRFAPDASVASLHIPVRSGSALPPQLVLAVHPLGRLIARVTLSAGSTVEDRIVVSGVFDLAVGAAVEQGVAELCIQIETGELAPSAGEMAAGARKAVAKPASEFVPLMLGDLEANLEPDIRRRGEEARKNLAAELARLDGYYRSMLEGPGGPGTEVVDPAARRAIEADHQRRRAEEERRHEVRASVHPLQLVRFELLVQRAEWAVSSASGRTATLLGTRALSGTGAWSMSCPTCGVLPKEILVCRQGHAACAACGATCSVCGEEFCRDHGQQACHVDSRPACGEHARTCGVCRKVHCTAHEGRCSEGDHRACSTCLSACALCGRVVCSQHSARTVPTAPRGSRYLCNQCVTHCEGGTSEPVGVDEVVRCASCSRFVCGAHQAVCAVDGQVHCSTHLRRSDRTRRLLCEKHRTTCTQEPQAIVASDEAVACTTCGASVCDSHSDVCSGDRERHCRTHLQPLHDTRDELGCERHRSRCHVDDRSYTLAGTPPCPLCTKPTCRDHLLACKYCGRRVCATDRDAASGRCLTCGQLASTSEPPDSVVAASVAANGGQPLKGGDWRVARDAGHLIAEVALGWSRKLVFSVRHGESVPDTVIRHSLLGSSRRK